MQAVHLLAFGMPSGIEWVIVLVVALLLFGRRLPEVMRGLGGGVREFRKGIEGSDDEPKNVKGDDAEKAEKVEHKAADSKANGSTN